jgi:hypothetical protein
MSDVFKTGIKLDYFVFSESVYTAYVKPNFTKYLGVGVVDSFYDSDILVIDSVKPLGVGIIDDYYDDDLVSTFKSAHINGGITPIDPIYLGVGLADNFIESDIYGYVKQNTYLGVGIQSNYHPFEKEVFAYISPKHLGIGIENRSTSYEKEIFSYTGPKHLGIAIEGQYTHYEKEIFSYLGPKHLGIAINNDTSEKEILSYLSPRHLGIAIKDNKSEKEVLSYLGPKHLGIAIKDNTSEKEILSYLGPKYLGIAISNKHPEKDLIGSSNELGPFLRFVCDSNTIEIQSSNDAKDLFNNLKSYSRTLSPKNVKNPGNWILEARATDKNNPNYPDKEKPRLLTHLIFDPITKPKTGVYYITYTLDIEVSRTPEKDPTNFYLPDEYRLPNTYEFHSTFASNVWYINHQLGFIPTSINVFVDNKIYTNYVYSHLDNNTTILSFDAEVSGVAQLG